MDRHEQDRQQHQSGRPPARTRRQILLWTCGLLVALAFLGLVICGYLFSWKWTGLVADAKYPKRTFWDWLGLLIVPVVLALGGYLFSRSESERNRQISDQRMQEDRKIAHERAETDRQIADQSRQDDTLQAYLDQMGALLLESDLRDSKEGSNVRTLARAQTLTVLPRLNDSRKGNVLQFLYESDLISKNHLIVDLGGADLSNAALRGAILHKADLSESDLSGANLSKADLSGANLSKADLRIADLGGANLRGADMRGALLYEANMRGADLNRRTNLDKVDFSEVDLRGANLGGANLSRANLSGAYLSGAYMKGVDLSDTKLGGVYLGGVYLHGANLSRADLSGLHDEDVRRIDDWWQLWQDPAPLFAASADRLNINRAQQIAALPALKERGAQLLKTNLTNADLTEAVVALHQLKFCNLAGATLPNGQKYEDWLRDRGDV